VLAAILLALGAAAGWHALQPPLWQSRTVVQLDQPPCPTSAAESCRTARETALGIAAAAVSSDALLDSVVPAAGKSGPAVETMLRNWLARVFPSRDVETNAPERRRAGLRAQLAVATDPAAGTLTITVGATSPEAARARTNAVLDAFLARQPAGAANPPADTRLARASVEIATALRLLGEAPAETAGEERPSSLQPLEADRVRELAELATRRQRVEQVERQAHDPLGAAGPQSQTMTTLRGRLADLARREADALALYGPQHPVLAGLKTERDRLTRLATDEAARLVQAARDEAAATQARVDALGEGIDRLKAERAVGASKRNDAEPRQALQAAAAILAEPSPAAVSTAPAFRTLVAPTPGERVEVVSSPRLFALAAVAGALVGLLLVLLRRLAR